MVGYTMRHSFYELRGFTKLFLVIAFLIPSLAATAMNKASNTPSFAFPGEKDVQAKNESSIHEDAADSSSPSLTNAFIDGDLAFVKESYRGNANGIELRRLTPMYIALFYGHHDLVKHLLSIGDNPNEPSYYTGSKTRTRLRKSCSNIEELKKKVPEFATAPIPSSPSLISRVKNLFSDKNGNQSNAEKRSKKQAISPTDVSPEAQNILGNVVITGETPIFLIAKQVDITAKDFELAQELFKYGASLSVEAQVPYSHLKKTPVTILEDQLRDLAGPSIPTMPERTRRFHAIKKKFLKTLEDRSIKAHYASIWYLFADGYTTTTLVEMYEPQITNDHSTAELITERSPFDSQSIEQKKIDLFPYLDALANWELDLDLPEPPEALDRYMRLKHLLSEKAAFNMLLKYFILRKETLRFAKSPGHRISFHGVEGYSPDEVAKAIYAVHYDQFLALNPRHVAIKSARGEESTASTRFFRGMDRLSNLVAHSIAISNKPATLFKFWRSVAEKSLAMNNLFATFSIYSGLSSRPVSLRVPHAKLGDLPNLQRNRDYCEFRQKITDPVIPTVIHDFQRLKTFFESKDTWGGMLVGAGDNKFTEVLRTIFRELVDDQTKLRSIPPVQASKQLYQYFSHIPLHESDQHAAHLWALRLERTKDHLSAATEMEPAEYWDTERFAAWLNTVEFKVEYTKDLVELGIIDGPTFLENYALAHYASDGSKLEDHKLAHLFLLYNGWLVPKKLKALTNLSRDHQFPVDLWANPQSTFQWIMWLRNNRLADTALPTLLRNNVTTFASFIHLHQQSASNHFENMALDKKAFSEIKHMAKLYVKREQQPSDMSKWQKPHLEMWLHENRLSHYIPSIKHDKVWRCHKVLSFLYVIKKFGAKARESLGRRYPWINRLSEHLPSDFVELIEQSAQQIGDADGISDQSYLNFIKVLVHVEATESILAFYKDEIYNFSQLKSRLAPATEFDLNESSPDLDEEITTNSARSYDAKSIDESDTTYSGSARSVDTRSIDESESHCSSTRSMESKSLDERDLSSPKGAGAKEISPAEFFCMPFTEAQAQILLRYGVTLEQQAAINAFFKSRS